MAIAEMENEYRRAQDNLEDLNEGVWKTGENFVDVVVAENGLVSNL